MIHGGRVGRREIARRAGLWAGAAIAGLGLLDACAGKAQVPAPAAQSAVTEVVFAPWGGWPAYAGPHWPALIRPGLDHFEQANRGIRVKVVAPGGAGSFLAAIVAGEGPDVFQDWSIAPYLESGAVLNLASFLRQDNIATTIWSPGQMRTMQDQAGVWFLPCYVHVDVMAVNLSILDGLGVAYPAADWTYREAAALFQAATGTVAGQHRYGVYLHFAGGSLGAPLGNLTTYLLHGFGGSMTDEARTGCMLGQAPAAAAVQWADALYWEGVAGGGALDLAHTAFVEVGSNALPKELQLWENAFKWSFFPVPRYPAGPASFEATDYYAINAATTRPEAAWVLLRFLAADAYWSRYCMHYLLRTPSMVSLWDEYILTVETVAPLAKGKGLHWFVEAARGWGVANRVFRYQHPEAVGLINTALGRAFARTQSVAAALGSVARAVDAMESSAAREQPVPLAQRMAAERRQKGRLARLFGAAG